MHAGASICFVVAIVMYGISWLPGAIGLGLLGACFELAAWIQMFANTDGDELRRNADDA